MLLVAVVTNTNACIRMSYAGVGIQSYSSPYYLSHCQFVNCQTAVYTSTSTNNVYAKNVLFVLNLPRQPSHAMYQGSIDGA